MKLPRLLPLNPLFLKSRVCFIRSLISATSSFAELLADIERCLRESEPFMAIISETGDDGRDGRGVRGLLTCRNYAFIRILSSPPPYQKTYLLKGKCMNRSVDASLADKKVMIDYGNMILG